MLIELTEHSLRLRRSDKRRWHQRWVFLRVVTLGGHGTGETLRHSFVILARLWARRSVSRNRWLFAEHRPTKSVGTGDLK